ncbi:hypothetical protein KH172YL63_42010 [Bacillus sp. KH172YL63]|nr:hypothetical protein KH172YL63_42010 [Bacillus sp. KH172YL63]
MISFVKNKYLLLMLSAFIFTVSFLIISYRYFNSKEINMLTSSCYENQGNVMLEIYDHVTKRYSFECEK